MFAAHPHGVLPLGICLNIGTNGTGIDAALPGIHFRGVAGERLLHHSLLRDLCLAMGGTDCREVTIRSLLSKGLSPSLFPEAQMSHYYQSHTTTTFG